MGDPQSQVIPSGVPADVSAADFRPSKNFESQTSLVSEEGLDNTVSNNTLRKRSFAIPTTQSSRKSARISERDSVSSRRPIKTRSADSLLFRLRGFRDIYNPALPLNELENFYNRHQFSTTVSGLNYDSDVIRNASMRAIWNLSQKELLGGLFQRRNKDGSTGTEWAG